MAIEGPFQAGWEGTVSQMSTDAWVAEGTEVFISTMALFGSVGREGGGICLP